MSTLPIRREAVRSEKDESNPFYRQRPLDRLRKSERKEVGLHAAAQLASTLKEEEKQEAHVSL